MAIAYCPVCEREVYLFAEDDLTRPSCDSSLVETADAIAARVKVDLELLGTRDYDKPTLSWLITVLSSVATKLACHRHVDRYGTVNSCS
jgi:hypothetical protein